MNFFGAVVVVSEIVCAFEMLIKKAEKIMVKSSLFFISG